MIVVDVRVGKNIQSFPGHDLPKWIYNNTYYKPIWKLYKSIIGFLSCQRDHCNNNYYIVELLFPNEKLLKSLSVFFSSPRVVNETITSQKLWFPNVKTVESHNRFSLVSSKDITNVILWKFVISLFGLIVLTIMWYWKTFMESIWKPGMITKRFPLTVVP